MWRGRSALRWLDCEMLSDARVLHVERRSAERAFRQQGRESLGGREGGRAPTTATTTTTTALLLLFMASSFTSPSPCGWQSSFAGGYEFTTISSKCRDMRANFAVAIAIRRRRATRADAGDWTQRQRSVRSGGVWAKRRTSLNLT